MSVDIVIAHISVGNLILDNLVLDTISHVPREIHSPVDFR